MTADPGTDLYELLSNYRARISENSWGIFSTHSYSFGRYLDQSPIKAIERLAYDEMTPRERADLDNPFAQPTRMVTAGKRRTRSFLQKYFRVLAAEGFVAGHRTLFTYLGGRMVQCIKGKQKSL